MAVPLVAPTGRRASLAQETSLRRSFLSIHTAHRPPSTTRSVASEHTTTSRRATTPPPAEDLSAEQQGQKQQEMKPPATNPRQWRRRSVSFAIDQKPDDQPRQQQSSHGQGKGPRSDYFLGETIRSPSHMVEGLSSQEATSAADLLKQYEPAFVRRSDRSFSYAIMAFRSFEPIKESDDKEECMTFVVSKDGSTKTVRRRHWSKLIRPVSLEVYVEDLFSVEGFDSRPGTPAGDGEEGGWVPLRMISFVPQAADDEECSMMSSVSDTAKAKRERHWKEFTSQLDAQK